MNISKKYLDDLTYRIIGCAIEVHKYLGPGLLESLYEKCFTRELELNGIKHKSQISVPLRYKGLLLDSYLRFDVLVEDMILVELKATDVLLPIYEAKLLTYVQMLEKPKGVLINFNCSNIFKQGQKTFVNEYYGSLPDN
jgi:GxxExxY protein